MVKFDLTLLQRGSTNLFKDKGRERDDKNILQKAKELRIDISSIF